MRWREYCLRGDTVTANFIAFAFHVIKSLDPALAALADELYKRYRDSSTREHNNCGI